MAESPSELQDEIEQLERKHAENPEGRYFVPLANDYRKLGDLERAEALLRAGLEKHPEYLSARIVLGRCLADRGSNAEAAEQFDYVLSMDPQNLIALRGLAELALADDRVADAERWYRELLAVDPMNADAREALDRIAAEPRQDAATPGEDGSWWAPESEEASDPEAAAEEGAAASEPEGEAPREVSDPAETSGTAPGPSPSAGRDIAEDLQEWELPEEVEAVEVVTETIAELYARQGLHERAAGVYRELIRRRGGDPELESRLAELERAAADEGAGADAADPAGLDLVDGFGESPGAGAGAPQQPASERLPDSRPGTGQGSRERDDAFAGSFVFGFGDGDDAEPESAAEEEPGLADWDIGAPIGEERTTVESDSAAPDTEPPTQPDLHAAPAAAASGEVRAAEPADVTASGQSIAEYLAGLAAWTPGAGAGEPSRPEPAAPQAAEPEPAEPEPGVFEPIEFEPLTPEAAEPEPAEPEPGVFEPIEFEPLASQPAEPQASEPDAAGPEPAGSAPASGPPEAEASEPVIELEDYFSDTDQAAADSAPAPAAEENDDDLESFQAWLRSLKR